MMSKRAGQAEEKKSLVSDAASRPFEPPAYLDAKSSHRDPSRPVPRTTSKELTTASTISFDVESIDIDLITNAAGISAAFQVEASATLDQDTGTMAQLTQPVKRVSSRTDYDNITDLASKHEPLHDADAKWLMETWTRSGKESLYKVTQHEWNRLETSTFWRSMWSWTGMCSSTRLMTQEEKFDHVKKGSQYSWPRDDVQSTILSVFLTRASNGPFSYDRIKDLLYIYKDQHGKYGNQILRALELNTTFKHPPGVRNLFVNTKPVPPQDFTTIILQLTDDSNMSAAIFPDLLQKLCDRRTAESDLPRLRAIFFQVLRNSAKAREVMSPQSARYLLRALMDLRLPTEDHRLAVLIAVKDLIHSGYPSFDAADFITLANKCLPIKDGALKQRWMIVVLGCVHAFVIRPLPRTRAQYMLINVVQLMQNMPREETSLLFRLLFILQEAFKLDIDWQSMPVAESYGILTRDFLDCRSDEKQQVYAKFDSTSQAFVGFSSEGGSSQDQSCVSFSAHILALVRRILGHRRDPNPLRFLLVVRKYLDVRDLPAALNALQIIWMIGGHCSPLMSQPTRNDLLKGLSVLAPESPVLSAILACRCMLLFILPDMACVPSEDAVFLELIGNILTLLLASDKRNLAGCDELHKEYVAKLTQLLQRCASVALVIPVMQFLYKAPEHDGGVLKTELANLCAAGTKMKATEKDFSRALTCAELLKARGSYEGLAKQVTKWLIMAGATVNANLATSFINDLDHCGDEKVALGIVDFLHQACPADHPNGDVLSFQQRLKLELFHTLLHVGEAHEHEELLVDFLENGSIFPLQLQSCLVRVKDDGQLIQICTWIARTSQRVSDELLLRCFRSRGHASRLVEFVESLVHASLPPSEDQVKQIKSTLVADRSYLDIVRLCTLQKQWLIQCELRLWNHACGALPSSVAAADINCLCRALLEHPDWQVMCQHVSLLNSRLVSSLLLVSSSRGSLHHGIDRVSAIFKAAIEQHSFLRALMDACLWSLFDTLLEVVTLPLVEDVRQSLDGFLGATRRRAIGKIRRNKKPSAPLFSGDFRVSMLKSMSMKSVASSSAPSTDKISFLAVLSQLNMSPNVPSKNILSPTVVAHILPELRLCLAEEKLSVSISQGIQCVAALLRTGLNEAELSTPNLDSNLLAILCLLEQRFASLDRDLSLRSYLQDICSALLERSSSSSYDLHPSSDHEHKKAESKQNCNHLYDVCPALWMWQSIVNGEAFDLDFIDTIALSDADDGEHPPSAIDLLVLSPLLSSTHSYTAAITDFIRAPGHKLDPFAQYRVAELLATSGLPIEMISGQTRNNIPDEPDSVLWSVQSLCLAQKLPHFHADACDFFFDLLRRQWKFSLLARLAVLITQVSSNLRPDAVRMLTSSIAGVLVRLPRCQNGLFHDALNLLEAMQQDGELDHYSMSAKLYSEMKCQQFQAGKVSNESTVEDFCSLNDIKKITKPHVLSSPVASLDRIDSLIPQLVEEYKKIRLNMNRAHVQRRHLSTHAQVHEVLHYLAIADTANQRRRGYLLHDAQIISCIELIFSSMVRPSHHSRSQGCVLQVRTGEGKTSIVSVAAAVLAMLGRTVDVISSSPILARRDQEESNPLFEALGLSSSCNADVGLYCEGAKACYASPIVYGDIATFQFDRLRQEYYKLHTLEHKNAARKADVLIVDEADNLMIDQCGDTARISAPVAGMDQLLPVYYIIWSLVRRKSVFILPIKDKTVFVHDMVYEGYGVDRALQSMYDHLAFSQARVANDLIKIPHDTVLSVCAVESKEGGSQDNATLNRITINGVQYDLEVYESINNPEPDLLEAVRNHIALQKNSGPLSQKPYLSFSDEEGRVFQFRNCSFDVTPNLESLDLKVQISSVGEHFSPVIRSTLENELAKASRRHVMHVQVSVDSFRASVADTFESLVEKTSSSVKKTLVEEYFLNGRLVLPKHLQDYVLDFLDGYVDSALRALHLLRPDEHYIARQGVIKIVDGRNTGVTMSSSVQWSEGLQQFLQIKHHLPVTDESLTSVFMSNFKFFSLYSFVGGVTGTCGPPKTRELFADFYGLRCLIVPTFKRRRHESYPPRVLPTSEAWLETIASSIVAEVLVNRAVLVICETIAQARLVSQLLKTLYPRISPILYVDSDNQESQRLTSHARAGDVFISTNLAGRGTDIKTNEVEPVGGLHVILTFICDNSRIEEQALGRTSRQGNFGSSQIIVFDETLRSELVPKEIDADFDELSPSLREILPDHVVSDWEQYSEESTAYQQFLETPSRPQEARCFQNLLDERDDVDCRSQQTLQSDRKAIKWKDDMYGVLLKATSGLSSEARSLAEFHLAVQLRKMEGQWTEKEAESAETVIRARVKNPLDFLQNPYYSFNALSDSIVQYSKRSWLSKVVSSDNLSERLMALRDFSHTPCWVVLDSAAAVISGKGDAFPICYSIFQAIRSLGEEQSMLEGIGCLIQLEAPETEESKLALSQLDYRSRGYGRILEHLQEQYKVACKGARSFNLACISSGGSSREVHYSGVVVKEDLPALFRQAREYHLELCHVPVHSNDMKDQDDAINLSQECTHSSLFHRLSFVTQKPQPHSPLSVNLSNLSLSDLWQPVTLRLHSPMRVEFRESIDTLRLLESVLSMKASSYIIKLPPVRADGLRAKIALVLKDATELYACSKNDFKEEDSKSSAGYFFSGCMTLEPCKLSAMSKSSVEVRSISEKTLTELKNALSDDADGGALKLPIGVVALFAPNGLTKPPTDNDEVVSKMPIRVEISISASSAASIIPKLRKISSHVQLSLGFRSSSLHAISKVLRQYRKKSQALEFDSHQVTAATMTNGEDTSITQRGFPHLFYFKLQLPFPWLAVLFLAFMAAVQIIAGALIIVCSAGALTTVGTGLISEGIADVLEMISVAITREFDMGAYLKGKAVSLAVSLAVGMAGKLLKYGKKLGKLGLNKVMGRANNSAVQASLKAVAEEAAEASAKNLATSVTKKAGQAQVTSRQLAKNVARSVIKEEAISGVTCHITNNLIGEVLGPILSQAEGSIRSAVEQHVFSPSVRLLICLNRALGADMSASDTHSDVGFGRYFLQAYTKGTGTAAFSTFIKSLAAKLGAKGAFMIPAAMLAGASVVKLYLTAIPDATQQVTQSLQKSFDEAVQSKSRHHVSSSKEAKVKDDLIQGAHQILLKFQMQCQENAEPNSKSVYQRIASTKALPEFERDALRSDLMRTVEAKESNDPQAAAADQLASWLCSVLEKAGQEDERCLLALISKVTNDLVSLIKSTLQNDVFGRLSNAAIDHAIGKRNEAMQHKHVIKHPEKYGFTRADVDSYLKQKQMYKAQKQQAQVEKKHSGGHVARTKAKAQALLDGVEKPAKVVPPSKLTFGRALAAARKQEKDTDLKRGKTLDESGKDFVHAFKGTDGNIDSRGSVAKKIPQEVKSSIIDLKAPPPKALGYWRAQGLLMRDKAMKTCSRFRSLWHQTESFIEAEKRMKHLSQGAALNGFEIIALGAAKGLNVDVVSPEQLKTLRQKEGVCYIVYHPPSGSDRIGHFEAVSFVEGKPKIIPNRANGNNCGLHALSHFLPDASVVTRQDQARQLRLDLVNRMSQCMKQLDQFSTALERVLERRGILAKGVGQIGGVKCASAMARTLAMKEWKKGEHTRVRKVGKIHKTRSAAFVRVHSRKRDRLVVYLPHLNRVFYSALAPAFEQVELCRQTISARTNLQQLWTDIEAGTHPVWNLPQMKINLRTETTHCETGEVTGSDETLRCQQIRRYIADSVVQRRSVFDPIRKSWREEFVPNKQDVFKTPLAVFDSSRFPTASVVFGMTVDNGSLQFSGHNLGSRRVTSDSSTGIGTTYGGSSCSQFHNIRSDLQVSESIMAQLKQLTIPNASQAAVHLANAGVDKMLLERLTTEYMAADLSLPLGPFFSTFRNYTGHTVDEIQAATKKVNGYGLRADHDNRDIHLFHACDTARQILFGDVSFASLTARDQKVLKDFLQRTKAECHKKCEAFKEKAMNQTVNSLAVTSFNRRKVKGVPAFRRRPAPTLKQLKDDIEDSLLFMTTPASFDDTLNQCLSGSHPMQATQMELEKA